MTSGHHDFAPAHEHGPTPSYPDLTRPALDGHALTAESQRRVAYAVHLLNEEAARIQGIDARIASSSEESARIGREADELEGKADANGLVFKGFFRKRYIDVHQMRRDQDRIAGHVKELNEFKTNPQADHSSHGHDDHHDPEGEALQKEPGFAAMKNRVSAAEAKVAARQKTMAIADGSVPATAAIRAQAQELVKEWGGTSFDIDVYRNVLLDAVAKGHEKRVGDNMMAKEKILFDQTESALLERVRVTREFARTRNPKLLVTMNGWRESLNQYRSQLLGFNPRSVDRFRARTLAKAQTTYETAVKDPGSADKGLADQIMTEKQIAALEADLVRLKGEPESDDQKRDIKKASGDLAKLKEKMKSWRVPTDELRTKILEQEREKRDALIEVAG